MKILYDNNEATGVLKRSIVANTYLFLDSHGDVHMPGIFSQTISERKDRIAHLHDHEFKIGARVGRPIQFKEQKVSWIEVGLSRTGETYILQMDSQIEKALNEGIYNEYLADAINQHSVSMEYQVVDIAMKDPAYEDEYKVWKEVYPLLGNPEEADELGMFWVVRKARLFEVSAVLIGSNELTPTLGSKNFQMLEQYNDQYKKLLHKSITESFEKTDQGSSKKSISVKELIKHYNPKKYI